MQSTILLLFFIINSVFSSICNEGNEETICEHFVFTPEITLNSAANVVTLKNVRGTITKNALSQLKIKEIRIISSDLDDIEAGALCSIPDLTSIDLIANRQIPKITRNILKDCQHLKRINFDGPEVIIEDGAFTDCENLQTMNLNQTKLPEELTKATFQGLNTLKHLTITNSKFTLTGDVFDGCKDLKILDLQSNQIDKIPDKIFANLSHLQVLYLSDNKLDNLTWDEFDGLKSSNVLFLERNPFTNVNVDKLVRNVPNLERIFLDYNNLTPENRQNLEETLTKLNVTIIYIGKYSNLL